MNKTAKHILWMVWVFCSFCAVAENDVQVLDTEISEVTVYADRALVSRTGKQTLPKGTSVWTVDGLPAWIDRGSIRVEIEPRGDAHIVDVQVSKTFHAKADDAALAAIEKEVVTLGDALQDIRDELSLLTARRTQVERISDYNIEKLPRDAVTRDVPVDTYKEVVEFVSSERREILEKQRALERQQRALEPERAAKEKNRMELQRLVRLEFSSVVLTV